MQNPTLGQMYQLDQTQPLPQAPQFQSRPIFSQAGQQIRQTLGDERVLRRVDQVLETSYSAQTQRQRWEAQQHGVPQYAPRSEQHPGVPQYTPGVKALYGAGMVSTHAAAAGFTAGMLGAVTMPGQIVGGGYGGRPRSKENPYFEPGHPILKWSAIGLVSMFLIWGMVAAVLAPDFGVGVVVTTPFLVLAFFSSLIYYLPCRTNRREAQIVGAIGMAVAHASLTKLHSMSQPPTWSPTAATSTDPLGGQFTSSGNPYDAPMATSHDPLGGQFR